MKLVKEKIDESEIGEWELTEVTAAGTVTRTNKSITGEDEGVNYHVDEKAKDIKVNPLNESVEPVIQLKKYTQLGDLCFDLLNEKQALGDNVLENKEEIWSFINNRLDKYIEDFKNNTGHQVPPGAMM